LIFVSTSRFAGVRSEAEQGRAERMVSYDKRKASKQVEYSIYVSNERDI
jgi:hypothetical protein